MSTLGIVYAVGGDADERSEPLRDALRDAKKPDGTRAYTPLIGAVADGLLRARVPVHEHARGRAARDRSWRWPAFLFGYMTVLAWVASFLVYQGGRLLGFG